MPGPPGPAPKPRCHSRYSLTASKYPSGPPCSDTVLELKQRAAQAGGTPQLASCRAIFQGRVLPDAAQLACAGVRDDHVVLLVPPATPSRDAEPSAAPDSPPAGCLLPGEQAPAAPPAATLQAATHQALAWLSWLGMPQGSPADASAGGPAFWTGECHARGLCQ